MEHGLKAGIYKIKSSDGAVLTATTEGRPRAVKTAPWEDLDTQKWKVKTRQDGDKVLQIVRNETIKDNEVSKGCKEGEVGEYVALDWKFTPVSPDTFRINNGVGFLTNNGIDQRVSFPVAEDEDGESQHWTFEFLSEITSK